MNNIIEFGKFQIDCFSDEKNRPCIRWSQLTPKGKRKSKVLKAYYFDTEQQRADWISKVVEQETKRAESKKQVRLERINSAKDAKVGEGDIFVWSWGWEQTNIDFFQVIERKGQSIVLKQITQTRKETGWCQGTCLPVKDSFKEGEKPLTKRIKAHPNGEVYVSTEYGYCHTWDGSAENWSSYA